MTWFTMFLKVMFAKWWDLDNYDNHPVVQAARASGIKANVWPVALYWDGVAYTKNDSFMAFYVTDLLTSQKFLSFLLRNFGMQRTG